MSPLKSGMDTYMNKITERCLNNYDKNADPNWIKYRDNPTHDKPTGYAAIKPTTKTYFMLLEYNYTHSTLTCFSRDYGTKISGTKKELTARLFAHLYFASFVMKIQKRVRGYLTRLFNNKLHGPACFKRSLCVNDSDFLTMEELITIPPMRFFSYEDVDGFVYGFDMVSLYNLIIKSSTSNPLRNPYNRKEIPKSAIDRFSKLVHIGKLLKLDISLELEPMISSSQTDTLNFRTLDLFQLINALGNYSDPQWFNDLDKPRLLRLLRELFDIWHYRLHISHQTKCAICPPHGSPFPNFSTLMLTLREEPNVVNIKNSILNILFRLVNTGIDRDSKCLGAYYVLGALTLVNDSAAQALPWLHQSMSYS
jgi:hypothetical protein